MTCREDPARVLIHWLSKAGYLQVHMVCDGRTTVQAVHNLIALTYLGVAPLGLMPCHGDGGPLDNRLVNLRYGMPPAGADTCAQNHPWTPENTMTRRSRNGRVIRKCKACHNRAMARYRATH